MADGGGFRTPCADFSRPVEELEYSCLLKSTFTQASHDRGFKTWQTPATYPECFFCGRKYRWGAVYVECHMDPNISKATTVKERVVTSCTESQSISRGPNRTRFLAVQAAIRAKMQCDKKTLLAEADTSKKRNLTLVGGYADNAVDLCLSFIVTWTYINIFCVSPHPPSVSEMYTQTHRDTGIKSAYVTDRFAIQFKAVRRLIMSEDFWDTLKLATLVLKPALVVL